MIFHNVYRSTVAALMVVVMYNVQCTWVRVSVFEWNGTSQSTQTSAIRSNPWRWAHMLMAWSVCFRCAMVRWCLRSIRRWHLCSCPNRQSTNIDARMKPFAHTNINTHSFTRCYTYFHCVQLMFFTTLFLSIHFSFSLHLTLCDIWHEPMMLVLQ